MPLNRRHFSQRICGCVADSVLNFIRSHPLMDAAVSHERDQPVYYTREATFTRLAVHLLHQQANLYRVFYAGTGTVLTVQCSVFTPVRKTHSFEVRGNTDTRGKTFRCLLEIKQKHEKVKNVGYVLF